MRSVSMGAGGEDILMSPAAQEAIPFSFEAKCVERLNIYAALEQAHSNCPSARRPAVVFRRNHGEAHVAIPWEAFLSLIHAAWIGRRRPPATATQDETRKGEVGCGGQGGGAPCSPHRCGGDDEEARRDASRVVAWPETVEECHLAMDEMEAARRRGEEAEAKLARVRELVSGGT